MRGLGTDHVISGPMRGLKKTASDGANKQTNRQTSGHRDSMTESAQLGRFSENQVLSRSFSSVRESEGLNKSEPMFAILDKKL